MSAVNLKNLDEKTNEMHSIKNQFKKMNRSFNIRDRNAVTRNVKFFDFLMEFSFCKKKHKRDQ